MSFTQDENIKTLSNIKALGLLIEQSKCQKEICILYDKQIKLMYKCDLFSKLSVLRLFVLNQLSKLFLKVVPFERKTLSGL